MLFGYSLLNRQSSAYGFHFSKVTKTARKNKMRPPIKYLNFTSRIICVCHHIDLYFQRTQNIRNRENQLLLGTIRPHKAVSTETISRWLVGVLYFAGTSTFKSLSTRAASTSEAKALGVPAKEILKRGPRFHYSTFEKHYCKGMINFTDGL